MGNEQQEVAELIRSGRYFDEARRWYQTMYLSPIAERCVFLLVAVVAGVIAIVGFLAVGGLLPITARPPVMIATPALDSEIPSIARLRARDKPLNAALAEFMVANYVVKRESYAAGEFAADMAFVRAHSDPTVLAGYDALYGPQNPRSPANILGQKGRRVVDLYGITLLPGEGDVRQAEVKFSTILEGIGSQAKTQWTARVSYYYSPMVVTGGVDNATGQEYLSVEEPQFKVVNYAVSQTP